MLWQGVYGTCECGPCRSIMHQRWSASTLKIGCHTWVSMSTITRSHPRSLWRWRQQQVFQHKLWWHSILGWTTYMKSFGLPPHGRQHGLRMQPIHCLEYSLCHCQLHMVRETKHLVDSWHSYSQVQEMWASLHGWGDPAALTVASCPVSLSSAGFQPHTSHLPSLTLKWGLLLPESSAHMTQPCSQSCMTK